MKYRGEIEKYPDFYRVRKALEGDLYEYEILKKEILMYESKHGDFFFKSFGLDPDLYSYRLIEMLSENDIRKIMEDYRGFSLFKTYVHSCLYFRTRNIFKEEIKKRNGKYISSKQKNKMKEKLGGKLAFFKNIKNHLYLLNSVDQKILIAFYGYGIKESKIAEYLNKTTWYIRQRKRRAILKIIEKANWEI